MKMIRRKNQRNPKIR